MAGGPAMTGRFLDFLLHLALYVMAGIFIGLALYLAMGGRGTETAASPSQSLTGPQTASEWRGSPLDASERVLEPLGLEQRQVEEAGVPRAAAVASSPLPRPLPKTEALSLRPQSGGGGEPPPSSPLPGCSSPCAVDVSFPDGESTPIPSVSLRFVVRSGIASTYGPGWSERWVALPDGPGWRFRVCGAGGCRTLVSTDAGPSLAMQRAGRIVDLPIYAFEAVCGVPWSMGLCQVSLTILGRSR